MRCGSWACVESTRLVSSRLVSSRLTEGPPAVSKTFTTHCPVACAGMVVTDHLCTPIDHLPAAGELVAVDELVLSIGGGAANTAIGLSRLGVAAAICARVGDDVFGR